MKRTFKVVSIFLTVFIFVSTMIFLLQKVSADDEKEKSKIEGISKTTMKKTGSLEDCVKNIKNIKVLDTNITDGYALIEIKFTADRKGILSRKYSEILKEVQKYEKFKDLNRVSILCMSDFIDKYGNNIESKVCSAEFKTSEISKINWKNFDTSSIFDLSDEKWFHESVKNK